MNKNRLTVNINGNDYTLSSSETREYMLSVADVVDGNMRAVCKLNPSLSTAMAAVLAALNTADDYLKTKKEVEELKARLNAELRRR